MNLKLSLQTTALAERCCMDQQLSPERLLSDFSKIPSAVGEARMIRARNNSEKSANPK
jgi:hypothetical protein